MFSFKNYLNNRKQLENARILTTALEFKFPIGLAIVFLLLATGYSILISAPSSAPLKCMESCRKQGLKYIYSPTGTRDGVHSGGPICICLKKEV